MSIVRVCLPICIRVIMRVRVHVLVLVIVMCVRACACACLYLKGTLACGGREKFRNSRGGAIRHNHLTSYAETKK